MQSAVPHESWSLDSNHLSFSHHTQQSVQWWHTGRQFHLLKCMSWDMRNHLWMPPSTHLLTSPAWQTVWQYQFRAIRSQLLSVGWDKKPCLNNMQTPAMWYVNDIGDDDSWLHVTAVECNQQHQDRNSLDKWRCIYSSIQLVNVCHPSLIIVMDDSV
jgi:hypothetical protein